MPENQPLIDQLLAAVDGDIAAVDISNPVDVERFLGDIVIGIDRAIGDVDKYPEDMPLSVIEWMEKVGTAYRDRQNLADAAFAEGGLQLGDLPATATASPVSQQAEDGGGDAQKAETPPSAPVSRPESADKPKASGGDAKVRLAFSARNPWGRGTKAYAAIDAVIESGGVAAHDIAALSDKTNMIEAGLKQAVIHALQAFDSLRERGWLDKSNPAVQSFIQSIEEVES